MQSSFEFNIKPKFETDDFFISDSNMNAYELINKWPNWNSHASIIYGPKACGKSHLAKIWQKNTGAKIISIKDLYHKTIEQNISDSNCFIIEDIENINDEVILFHLYNAIKEYGKYILFTSIKHPSNMNIRLPDLRSRLCSIPHESISLPDDQLIKTIFVKHMTDHQLNISMEVIDFLCSRIERSFSIIGKVINILDQQSLNQKKNITIPFAKQVLDDYLVK